MMAIQGLPGSRLSNFGHVDLCFVQSSTGPTLRPSNFVENCTPKNSISSPRFTFYPTQIVIILKRAQVRLWDMEYQQ
ncbi:auxin efflux carrier component 3-like [Mercurialis annua]|uniref:auxin efflux carrier component 3-like n=1 Tax=Mercurialis annua TaxID=3986 RepID=UPI0021602CB7|nr:auxin efflux carrier component 3-like [Mercurialis annua]